MGIRGVDHYKVRSKMAILQKDLKKAELEFLAHGKVDDCIDMYQRLGKHGEAIRVAQQVVFIHAHENY